MLVVEIDHATLFNLVHVVHVLLASCLLFGAFFLAVPLDLLLENPLGDLEFGLLLEPRVFR